MARISLGSRLKKRRKELGLTQKKVSELAKISVSYLNLIENNRRPVGDEVLKRIASALEVSESHLTGTADQNLLQELDDIAKDPLFNQFSLEPLGVQEIVGSYPEWAKAVAHLFNSYQSSKDSLNELSDIFPEDMLPVESSHRILSLITSIRSFSEILAEEDLGELERERFSKRIAGESRQLGEITRSLLNLLDISGPETPQPFAMGEVEDFIIDNNNYFPDLEQGAEDLRNSLEYGDQSLEGAIVNFINDKLGVTLSFSNRLERVAASGYSKYRYSATTKRLILSEQLPRKTIIFQLAKFISEQVQRDALEKLAANSCFSSDEAGKLAFQAMARYAAGAFLFPYHEFLEEAEKHRYDIQLLGQRFHGSFEQICHRLVTLRNPDAKGIPLAFLRSDPSGNLTKRFNLPNLRFPRYGSACPIWVLYRSFMKPMEVCTQLARMPDNQSFLFVSRTVSKGARQYGEPERLYSIMIACDVAHMDKVVYGDSYNPQKESLITEAGVSCKLCVRTNCHHRAHALIHPLTRSVDNE